MKIQALLIVCSVVLAAPIEAAGPPKAADQCAVVVGETVKTTSGPIQGHAAPGAPHVSEYLGIPYALPPVGSLRFKPPVEYKSSSTINGSSFGFSCMQPQSGNVDPDAILELGIPASALSILQALSPPGQQSEDCLTLNIWTRPQKSRSRRPVLVWIHGGGYTSGSSSVPAYSGRFIANQEDVIIVSINYRLNVFGFPGNPVTSPNLGILDARMALQWVRDNIDGFHGDRNKITLFGQSAGGALVDHLGYGWASDPIAAGFIPMSGVADGFGIATPEIAAEKWFNVTRNVGCDGCADAVTRCMLSKSATEIVNGLSPSGSGLFSVGGLGPVADEIRVFSDYTNRKPANGAFLIGNTNNEAGLFRVFSPGQPEIVYQTVNNATFNCPAARTAERTRAAGRATWRYRWFGDFPNLVVTTTPPSGAWHTSDIPVLFDTSPQQSIPNTEEQIAIGKYIRGAWSAFAKDPEKGLLSYKDGWPKYDPLLPTLVRTGFSNRTGINVVEGVTYDQSCS